MVDLFLYSNPNVILPLETRLAINRLGIGRNQKKSGITEEKEQVGRSRKGAPDTIKTAMNRVHLSQDATRLRRLDLQF